MQDDPRYDDVVDDVKAFLAERIEFATSQGVAEERIWIDPGIGFGKTLEHNLELLRRLGELGELGRPIVVGTSRKSFIGKLTGREVDERLGGTIASNVLALLGGAEVFRVHDVAELRAGARRRRGDPGPPCLGAAGAVDPRVVRRQVRSTGRARFAGTVPAVEAHRQGLDSAVEVELRGLSIYTHHGVTEAEREIGQRLEIDVSFDVPDCDAVLTDRLEDTVDYAEVCDIVALAATERSYKTLERLCHVIGERLMERFGCESVRVRAAKPEPPLPLAVERGGGRGRSRAPDPRRATRTSRVTAHEPGGSRAVSARVGYLGLGSNVGDRAAHLRAAVAAASRARGGGGGRLLAVRDRAGRRDPRPARLPERRGPDPHRARARGAARLCKAIEVEQGRMLGGPRHGPRPLDVDLLLLGDLELRDRRLTLPHPQVTSRRFVLEPLLELDPELALPDGTRLARARWRALGPGAARSSGWDRSETGSRLSC